MSEDNDQNELEQQSNKRKRLKRRKVRIRFIAVWTMPIIVLLFGIYRIGRVLFLDEQVLATLLLKQKVCKFNLIPQITIKHAPKSRNLCLISNVIYRPGLFEDKYYKIIGEQDIVLIKAQYIDFSKIKD
ncbi:MAG: hypothetical protein ISR65_09345 [Bacteriovoracaceae bacterium]|nr:hypothetical protein [Bacteriovoracaceae bacterium]